MTSKSVNNSLQIAELISIVYRSEDPKNIFCYSPGIAICDNGRLVVTLDLGGSGVANLTGSKGSRAENTRFGKGKIFTSDDNGNTWVYRIDYPFWHARPFVVGNSLYILGQSGDLMIMKSNNNGATWSDPEALTSGQKWHGAPCNVHYANEHVYLAMDKREKLDVEGWNVSGLAPILLRANINSDLLNKSNWAFSDPIVFREAVETAKINYIGIPFFTTPDKSPVELSPNRFCSPIGWLEPNVVQFKDPSHYFYQGENTFHLFLRAHTGSAGFAAIVKVTEDNDRIMHTSLENAPSGKSLSLIPMPGGHLKFHILYDEVSKLFWLISNQSTDSMTRVEHLGPERFNLPNNERNRLQLNFSKNCVDWCFAGILACGEQEKEARNYASMIINGNDINFVCRSGDQDAFDAQYTNLITFHTIKDFRNLVY